MTSASTTYREDLVGIRGIAVLGVILFHAGFSFASGGYAGVDIFFVLSGFLVSSSIQSSLKKGQFTFSTFYLRRALRILPAAITVLVVVGFVGLKVLLPEELEELSESALSFLMMQSNVWASKSISYFGIGVKFKPLIHYWSLSIELQFYLLFPLLLTALLRKNRKNLLILICFSILILSLLYAGIRVGSDPDKYYFSSTMRIWEFSLGVLISLFPSHKTPGRLTDSSISAILGAGYFLIFFSFFLFDEQSLFPGFPALLPCLGTALILKFGSRRFYISRCFSTRWLQFLGIISFSLYLVHQPVMAFYRVLSGRDIEGVEPYGLIVLSIVAGAFLYTLVERPLQGKRLNLKSALSVSYVVVFSCTAFFVSYRITEKSFSSYSLSEEVSEYLRYRYDNNPRMIECRTDNRIIDPDQACLYGKEDFSKVAIWGDSHADQLVDSLSRAFSIYNHSVLEYAIAGCPPITNTKSPLGNRKCAENSRLILKHLTESEEIKHVILHAYWIGYLDEGLISSNSNKENLLNSFRQVIKTLLSAGKKVHVIYPVPKMKVNPPLFMARKALLGENLKDQRIEIEQYEFKLQSAISTKFLDEAIHNLDVNSIHISRMLFNSDRLVYPGLTHNKVLYRDDNHLSVTGADYVGPAIAEEIFENQGNLPASNTDSNLVEPERHTKH